MDEGLDRIIQKTRQEVEAWISDARVRREGLAAEALQLDAEITRAAAWLGDEEQGTSDRRRMTLQDAMALVLSDGGNLGMKPKELADEIARRDLYTMRDGRRVGVHGIQARVTNYPDLFYRESGLIRLKN